MREEVTAWPQREIDGWMSNHNKQTSAVESIFIPHERKRFC